MKRILFQKFDVVIESKTSKIAWQHLWFVPVGSQMNIEGPFENISLLEKSVGATFSSASGPLLLLHGHVSWLRSLMKILIAITWWYHNRDGLINGMDRVDSSWSWGPTIRPWWLVQLSINIDPHDHKVGMRDRKALFTECINTFFVILLYYWTSKLQKKWFY